MTRRATPWWLYLPSPLTATLFGLLGTTGPEFRAVTGIGYGGIAAIFVAQTLGTVCGAAAAGFSRAWIFRPMPMTLAVAGALTLTLAVDDALALLPLMFVAGFGCYAINARAQADLWIVAGASQARALALFHVFGGLGLALFPLSVAVLFRAGGSWQAPFVLVGVLFGAYAVACPYWRHSGDPPGLRMEAAWRLFRGRTGAALLVACLGTGVMFAVPLWIPTLMHDRFGWSAATASLSSALYMISLLVARMTVTSLANRVDGRRVLVVAATIVVLGHLVLFVAWSSTILLVATVAVAAGAGPLLPVGIARVARWSRDERLGTAAVMGLAALSQIVFPALVVAVHAAGLSLQHAASITIFPALLIVAAARRA